jgi:hypothetical protein
VRNNSEPHLLEEEFHLLESNLGSRVSKKRNIVIITKSQTPVNISSNSNLRMNNNIPQNRTPRVLSRALQNRSTAADNRDISISLDLAGREEHDGVSQSSTREVGVVDGHDVAVFLVFEVSGAGVEGEAGGDG